MILVESFLVTLSFFSTLPVKILEWTNERIRFIPIMMGFVGVVIGGIIVLVFSFLTLEPMIKALLFIVLYTVLTGGLHNDALMDTSDAHFSRRDIDKKLEIMTDSRVGAFAVMSYVNYVILFFVVMYYYFTLELELLMIVLVLFNSRALVGVMNYNLKYAKEDGLARMYATTLKQRDKYWLYFFIICANAYAVYLNLAYGLILLSAVLFYHLYKRFMYKQFRGITGDLLGTFVLLSELVMMGALIVWNLL